MKKFPASSLLEVLVAGVLLCIIVGVSFMILMNVQSGAPSFRKHQLEVLLQEHLNSMRSEPLKTGERIDTIPGGGTLVAKVSYFQNSSDLFVIDLQVTDARGKVEACASVLHYQYDQVN